MTASPKKPAVPRPFGRNSVPPGAPRTEAIAVAPVATAHTSSGEQIAPELVVRDKWPTVDLNDEDLMEVESCTLGAPPSKPARAVPTKSGVLKKVEASVVAPATARLDSIFDPAEVLFEGMYQVELATSAWQAASVCATALQRALGARSVVVHSHDLVRRELCVIGVQGEGSNELGSTNASDDDLVASAALCNERAVTLRFENELPRLAPSRLAILGAPHTLVAVPAMAWGRRVALIEIVDSEERFSTRVAGAGAYVAERLAAYLSGRMAA
jgi:hypothetical protein